MDFVTIRDLRVDAGKVWEKLETERELVVNITILFVFYWRASWQQF